MLKLELKRQTWGEDWGWLHRDILKGLECSMAITKDVLRGCPGQPQKQSTTVKERIKEGAGPTMAASFSALSADRAPPL